MNKTELINKIQDANAAYAAGIPFMTDEAYDILWQELYKLDPTNSLLYHTANRGSLTGADWHKFNIYGTQKAFCMEHLKPFLTRFGSQTLTIEPKYDGCAVVMTATSNGWKLSLEGDGKCGQDISHKIQFINFPDNLKHFQSMEVLIPLSDWQDDFGKNPRNTVAGWLARKHDIPPIKMTAISHNYGPLHYDYQYDGNLDNLGELLLNIHSEWSKIFPIDGIMLKVKDENTRLVAANNGQVNNWSIAWKPPIQTKVTIVRDIEWNVSRLGRVIPTIIYDPIELCGTTNSRVTGNNATWIKEREIQIGSHILVGKAGEIIPKIISVDNSAIHIHLDALWEQQREQKTENTTENFDPKPCLNVPCGVVPTQQNVLETYEKSLLPERCPTCESQLTQEGVHLICNSDKCIAKLTTSIAYFYSAKGIKVDGIAEATIEKLLNNTECYNVLKDKPWAILDPISYNLYPPIYSILGDKIYNKTQNEINKLNLTKNMAHFISGLGLPGLAYKTTLRLCQFLKSGKLNIHISDKAQQSFIKAVTIYNDAINEMKYFKFAPLPSPAKAIYCITGTLSIDRLAMITKLEAYNYEFSSGVTRETNYLIVGDDPGKTKIAKANKYNIPQVSEEQLFKILTGD